MSVKVGIISDTHDRIGRDVLDKLTDCDYILHAGDVTTDALLDKLRPLGRLYVVAGNSDCRSLADKLVKKLSFTIEGVRFLMVHEKFRAGAAASGADVIIYGHTHQSRRELIDGRLWLNPGSCSEPRGPFGRSMAFLTLDSGRIIDTRIVELS